MRDLCLTRGADHGGGENLGEPKSAIFFISIEPDWSCGRAVTSTQSLRAWEHWVAAALKRFSATGLRLKSGAKAIVEELAVNRVEIFAPP
jgi:hypothetical protein